MRIHSLLPHLPLLQKTVRNYSVKKRLVFPSLLSIELTNCCNASCIMCPRGKMTRAKKHMEFSVFKKVINDSINHPLKKINLFWFGESLVYPRFLEALEYIKESLPGVKVHLSTNAGLLEKSLSEKIARQSLVSTINIDLDGLTKESAEKIRPGTRFDDVTANINSLLAVRRSVKKSSLKVRITIIEMDENRDEIPEFRSYWEKRVNKVDVNSYNTWTGNLPDVASEKESGQRGFEFPCEHPWNELIVAADGRAGLCCLDFDLKAVVGDVKTATLEEIWNGKKLNFYRNKLLKLDYKNIVCQNCNAYIFQKKSFWRSIWIA